MQQLKTQEHLLQTVRSKSCFNYPTLTVLFYFFIIGSRAWSYSEKAKIHNFRFDLDFNAQQICLCLQEESRGACIGSQLCVNLTSSFRVLRYNAQLGSAVKNDARNLEDFERSRGFSRISTLLRWFHSSFQAPAVSKEGARPLWPGPPTWTSHMSDTTAEALGIVHQNLQAVNKL